MDRCIKNIKKEVLIILWALKLLIQISVVNDVDFQVISWLVVLLYDLPLSVCGELAPEDCRLTLIALGRSCIIALWHLIAV